MARKRWLKYSVFIIAALYIFNSPLLLPRCEGQEQRRAEREFGCRDNWHDGRLASHCEVREATLPASGGKLSIDGSKNGGISVRGWERDSIMVRAKVQAAAKTEAEARELASQVRVDTGGNQIRAEGPSFNENRYW